MANNRESHPQSSNEVIDRVLELGGRIIKDGHDFFLINECNQTVARGESFNELLVNCIDK